MIALPGIVIHSKIYESSVSVVYRGIRVPDDLAIVIKVLKQDYPSPQELTRYRQEYEITRSLNLAGVVKAYSQQDYQRTLIILLEDFGGESLTKWMRTHSDFCPMPLATFLPLAIAITGILGKIHAAKIVHKDINPGNIVFNPDTGDVKIIDFGIATQFNRTNPTFKSPYILEGTLAYLSPEQTGRMNRSLDYRTDFYSLGVTFYELLTGQLPFTTTDMLELVHCHIAKQPVPPHELNATIPKPVADIILKLMAKNAEDRYQSAWGVKADLELCTEQLAASGQINSIQLGLQDVSDQFQIPQKLYGREAEIAALLAAFERVAGRSDAERGNIAASSEMLLVSGYSGIGKSALVQELYKPITAKRGYFISGKFDQFQRNIPYSAIVDALRKLVQQLLGEPDARVQQWRLKLLTALGSNGQLIIDVIPEVELIVGKQSPVPDVGSTEAQNRFNLVFQKFIRACCSYEHPLVIFLDDLQWVDFATLKLIELILSDQAMQFLLLIGAYRNNEVTQIHPLAAMIEKLKQENVAINQITLAPLEQVAVAQLLAETLPTSSKLIAPLAKLIWHKTNGNPHFTNEFLKTLYTEDLIVFNVNQQHWEWDIAQIKAKKITDNVVELMVGKLKKLPEETQRVLGLAACVGAEFDLSTLSVICERSAFEIFAELTTVMQLELISATSELDENLLIQNYKFSHDRVQQAAYALIDPSQKQTVHLQIGRNLLEKTPPEQTTNRLFEVVDHLNYGIELVTNQAEREEIARLNLLAGQRAKGAIAYSAALRYLNTAIEFITLSSWQQRYDISLALYSEAAEVAYLYGDFDQMEQWMEIVLQQAKTILDKIRVFEVKIQTCKAQNQPLKAINIGLDVLEQLGVSLPESPTQVNVQQKLAETKTILAGRSIEAIVNLPAMAEAGKLAAMQILSNISSPTYSNTPILFILVVLEQVNLSIQYGNTPLSTYSYACYGILLNTLLQNTEDAYQFGLLALNLVEHLAVKSFRSKTFHTVAFLILPFHQVHSKHGTQEVLPLLKKSYVSGIESGDLEYAGFAASSICQYSYWRGLNLMKVSDELTIYCHALAQFKQEGTLSYTQIWKQVVANLRSDVETPCCLSGESYNEERLSRIQIELTQKVELFFFYINKLILYYLFENLHQATDHAALAERYLDCATSSIWVSTFYLYDSLSRLAVYSSVPHSDQENCISKVTNNQRKMQNWAHYAPPNFKHKHDLVEAEKARVLGQFFEAEELYERAIQGARDNEYLQEEALAYELTAKHYLARGREKIAQTYMKESHYCYERWGATAKVKDLETRYPQLFPHSSSVNHPPIFAPAGTTSDSLGTAFDLAAVMKASQAISSEIELDQLLGSLMQILIENAGAQTGFLILEHSGEWTIEATCELNKSENVSTAQVLQSIPIANNLPESIVNYVIRTHESVILNDATREGNFINEPYIQQHQIQSILCLPLLNQSKLVGVLYLENQLAAGAFTPERTQVLHLLSTQAAIAIENAKLYSKLRASESQMTQFLEAIPVGIGIIDATGRPYYANQQGIQLLGKGIDPSVPSDQIAEVYQFYVTGTNQMYPTERMPIIRALSRECATIDDVEIRQNDKIIPVEVWGTPVFDEQGNVAYAIAAFQDITERRQAERLLADYNQTLEQQVAERTADLQASEVALRHREQELRLITDVLPAPIGYVDADRRYQFINRTYEVWFSRSRDEILGKSVRELLGESVYQRIEPYIDRVFSGQTVTFEAELPFALGKKFISATLIPGLDGDDRVRGYYSLITDITEQRNAALRERNLAEAASIVEERNRMAREIHDTLAQSFTGILLQVGAATQVLVDDLEATQSHLDTIDELARTGLTEARRSVTALRPLLLEDGSLDNALCRLVTQMRAANDTDLIYEIKGTVYPLPAEVENNLLRIGQEALTNAIKYADAGEIRVELVYEKTQCLLRIKDNGRGFGVGSISPIGGFGLLGMSERAENIGAQLMIQSQPGQGTEIIAIVNRE